MNEKYSSPRMVEKTLLGLSGEFLVAAKLCLMGYVANLTLKNYPGVDVFVHNPRSGKTVSIQVKTALEGGKYPFIVANASYEDLARTLEEKIRIPHVLVYIPQDRSLKRVRFFVVPPEDVKRIAINTFEEYWKRARLAGRKLDPKAKHVIALPLEELKSYEDRWDLLGLE